MNVILDCAVDGSAVPALARRGPLVLAPFLGATVLQHALAALAADGVKRVWLCPADPPDPVRQVVAGGKPWGLEVQYAADPRAAHALAEATTVSLESLPQLPAHPLWRSYRDWYAAHMALLTTLATQRLGMKAVAPDVFVGLRSQVAPSARLLAPCWIGANVFVGPHAVIGPGTVIEDGCCIDRGAEVAGSIVAPRTYVGKFTEVRDTFASGSALLHLDTGSLTHVTDRFLLAALPQPNHWLGRWSHRLRQALRRSPSVASRANLRSLGQHSPGFAGNS